MVKRAFSLEEAPCGSKELLHYMAIEIIHSDKIFNLHATHREVSVGALGAVFLFFSIGRPERSAA